MTTRRKFVRLLTVALVALGITAVPVLAAEFFGVITKVDVENKTLTVKKKGGEEVIVNVNDKTEYETPRKSGPLDLSRLEKQLKKRQGEGKKGLGARITHEDNLASKIAVGKKKSDD